MALFGPESITDALRREGGPAVAQMVAHTQVLPGFRYVDVYRSALALVQGLGTPKTIVSQQVERLEALLHPNSYGDRTAARAAMRNFSVSKDRDEALPTDCFWIIPPSVAEGPLIFRVRYLDYAEQCELSVAGEGAKALADRILEGANTASIFRNEVVTLSYEAGKRDEYGDVEKPEKLTVGFLPLQPVDADNIVLSERQTSLISRNIIELDTRRNVLHANQVPARRGILLHGPPGTGKTHACRYIAQSMTQTTRIFLTGTAIANVTGVFSLARLLQPSVVFIEDADLMFSSREINLYSTSLGELMDQLDGLRANEEVSLVMTTNAIDRLEAALKDRPGRISQCIYMGEPGPDLRERFLLQELQGRALDEIDIAKLVAISDGATQAFLKEWAIRSLQIASERIETDEDLRARTGDFTEALDEMRSDRDEHGNRIIGFQASAI